MQRPYSLLIVHVTNHHNFPLHSRDLSNHQSALIIYKRDDTYVQSLARKLILKQSDVRKINYLAPLLISLSLASRRF